jgi:zinc protease
MEQNDNPLARMLDATYDLAYGKQGYGLPTGGTVDSIQGLGRPDLQRAHDTYYSGPNMAVVVVGDVETARAHEIVAEAFGAFPGGEPADDTAAAEWQPAQTTLDLQVPDARPLYMIGFPGPAISTSRSDPCAADVIMALLSEGRQSRFAKHAEAHEGLLGSASCMYLTQQHPGLFYIWGVADEGQMDASVEAILAIITDLRTNGISKEELQYGKDLIVGSFAVQSETYPDQAGTLGFYESTDSYEFAVDYEELVRAVTMEDVERVLQTYLDPARHTLVRILP